MRPSGPLFRLCGAFIYYTLLAGLLLAGCLAIGNFIER